LAASPLPLSQQALQAAAMISRAARKSRQPDMALRRGLI